MKDPDYLLPPWSSICVNAKKSKSLESSLIKGGAACAG
jgi:hypothetical protein